MQWAGQFWTAFCEITHLIEHMPCYYISFPFPFSMNFARSEIDAVWLNQKNVWRYIKYVERVHLDRFLSQFSGQHSSDYSTLTGVIWLRIAFLHWTFLNATIHVVCHCSDDCGHVSTISDNNTQNTRIMHPFFCDRCCRN